MRADQRKFHYIYKITRADGKFYVGMHSTDDLDDGYFGSGQLLWKSIKKHGKEKHSKEILEFLPGRKEMKDRERELVNEELLGNKLCMNLKLGGEGGWDHVTPAQKIAGGKAGGKVTGPRNLALANTATAIEKRVATFKSAGHNFSGERNGQFGTVWVIKDQKPIKIKKDLLEAHVARGYRRGRK